VAPDLEEADWVAADLEEADWAEPQGALAAGAVWAVAV
jgi:hypothetical protein